MLDFLVEHRVILNRILSGMSMVYQGQAFHPWVRCCENVCHHHHRSRMLSLVDGKNESILILRNISRFHSGRVDCSASNALSTVNRQFLLYVKCKFFFFSSINRRFSLSLLQINQSLPFLFISYISVCMKQQRSHVKFVPSHQ